MASSYDWSVIAGNNSSADSGINWAEGQDPGSVNDSARQMMARFAEILGDLGGALSAGGTANGLTVTANSAFTTLAEGRIIAFRATASNTGAATLNVNGIGAKALRKMGTTADVALDAGDIVNTGIYVAQYSAALNGAAGAWLLINATRTGKATTVQPFPAGATWTKPAGCRFADFEGQGGGAGSGGLDGIAGRAGSCGGGGSGFYGRTGPLDVSAVVSAVVTIGAAGAGGAAGNNVGGNGGNTAITIGATTYTWGGGTGANGYTANLANCAQSEGGLGGVGTNVEGYSQSGTMGVSSAGDANATGGNGGSSHFGRGGQGSHVTTATHGGGAAGTGRGAGGGGAVNGGSSVDVAGVAGTAGYMRVWEYY